MMYIISFKNGHKMEVDLKDGVEFIDSINKGVGENPTALNQFYREGDILINVLEITAIHPFDMDITKV